MGWWNRSSFFVALTVAIGCGPALTGPGESETGTSSEGRTQTGSDATSNGPVGTTTSGPPASTTVASTTTATVTTLPPGDSSNGFIFDIPDHIDPSCSVWLQDCGEGEKCAPWAVDGGDVYNSTRCVPVSPNPNAPGDACAVEGISTSGVDDCDAASMCFGVTDEGVGICEPFCIGEETQPLCADPGRSCVSSGGGVLALCLPNCDPLLQDCATDYGCYPWGSGFICGPDATQGQGVDDVACSFLNDCALGYICVPAAEVADCTDASCCTPYCSVAEPNSCAGSGEECVPLFERGEGPPQFDDHGVCSLP